MNKLITQIIRFGFVGGTATLLDFIILYILNQKLHVNHLIAATIAFVIATFYNYYLSMKFVFVSKYGEQDRKKEMLIFYLLSLVGLAITIIGLALLVDVLHYPVMISKIIVGVFVVIFNFVSRKIFLE